MNLNLLNKIHKVDTPPFLFTRVKQKIISTQASEVPKKLVWALSLSFMLIIILNISAVIHTEKSKTPEISLAQSMNLLSNNNLYQ